MSFSRPVLIHAEDSRLEYEDISDVEREDAGSRTRTPSPDTRRATHGGLQKPNVEPGPALPPRFGAGFWDKDPSTTRARNTYFKVVLGGSILTIIAIFAVLSIYWGALWKLDDKIHNLRGLVVDFDGGEIGQFIREAVLNATGAKEQISWSVADASQFPNGPQDVGDAIVKERAWIAIAITPNATNLLNAAISNANSSYNGTLAVTVYGNEARNENAYPLIIVPMVQALLIQASTAFAEQNSRQLASSSSATLQTLLSQAPTVVTQPVSYQIINLRPFDVPVATAVDFVGLIYLLILSFIIAMMNFNARVVVSGLNHHLRVRPLILLRIISPFVMYFFISFFYSLLSLAFQTPFRRVFGGWGFVIFWMMNYMGMCALGLAMEAMITLLTPAFAPFFLVLWIISNVSVCYFPIELLPAVFRYGYAAPFYNVSRTVRTIVFNTRNQIGLNFGVQFAWIAVSLITIPLFQYALRRKAEKQWHKEHEVDRIEKTA